MKSIVIAAIIAVGSSCAAAAEDCQPEFLPNKKEQAGSGYGYLKLSDQWVFFPGFGGGYRFHDRHGFDFDLTAYTYWHSGWLLYGKAHYLFYPQRKHFYLGVGTGCVGGALDIKNPFAIFGRSRMPKYGVKPTLEGVIGYEWQSKRYYFLQLEAGVSYGRIPLYPVLSFGMGL